MLGIFNPRRNLVFGTAFLSLMTAGCLEIENPVDRASFQHRAAIHFSVKYTNAQKVVWTTTYNDASGASKTVHIGTGGSFDYAGLELVGGNPTVHLITAYDPGNSKEKDTSTITITPACADGACPGSGCLKGVCDRIADVCTKVKDDGLCSDGTVCTGIETCLDDGSCKAGTPPACNDGNQCTDDGCDPAAGCVYTPKSSGSACDDGVFCNGADSCDGAGGCAAHAGDPCAGGDVCSNTCNEEAKNCFSPVTKICRTATDVCDLSEFCDGAGACPADSKAEAGTSCDDGAFCNGTDACDGTGGCLVHSGDPCAGGDVCNNSCNEQEKNCFSPAPTLCRARKAFCDAAEYCTGFGSCPDDANVADGTPCDDGNMCSMTESCLSGACTVETTVVCAAPPSQCHEAGVCDPASGECKYAFSGTSKSCNDGLSCTLLDRCDGKGGCKGTRDPTKCLIGGQCYSGGARSAQNRCQWCDVLSNSWANIPAILGYSCDDGDKCTNSDKCSDGACHGTANTCQNPPSECYSTPGACNPSDGACIYDVAVFKTCSDGAACTVGHFCDSNAVCSPGTTISCPDDGNACNGIEQCSEVLAACVTIGANPCAPQGKQCRPGLNNTYSCDGVNVTTIGGTAGSNVYILSEAQMWPDTTAWATYDSAFNVTKLNNDEDARLMTAAPGSYIVSGVKHHFFRQIKSVSDNGSTILVEFEPGWVSLSKGVTQVGSDVSGTPLVHSRFGRRSDGEEIHVQGKSARTTYILSNGALSYGYDADLYFRPEFRNATNISPDGASQEGNVTGVSNLFSTWIRGTLAVTIYFDEYTPTGPIDIPLWNQNFAPGLQMIGKFPLIYNPVMAFKIRVKQTVTHKGSATWFFRYNDAKQESTSTWTDGGTWEKSIQTSAGTITVDGPYASKDTDLDFDVFAFAEAGLQFFGLISVNVGVGPFAHFDINPGDPSCGTQLSIGRRVAIVGESGFFGPRVTAYGPEKDTVEATPSPACVPPFYCDTDGDGEYSAVMSGAGEMAGGCVNAPGTDCNDFDPSRCRYCDSVCDCVDKGCNDGKDRGCEAVFSCPAYVTATIKDYYDWGFKHMYWDDYLRAGWYIGGPEDGYYRSYAQFDKGSCTRTDDGFLGELDGSWTFKDMQFRAYVTEKSGSTSALYKPRVQLHPMSNDLNRTLQERYDDAGDGDIYNKTDDWVPFSLDPAWQTADLGDNAKQDWQNAASTFTVGVQNPGDHDLRGSFGGMTSGYTPYLTLRYGRTCQ